MHDEAIPKSIHFMKPAVPKHNSVNATKRRRTLRNVSANGTVPKAVLANMLMGLHAAGYLDGSIIGSSSSTDTAQQRTVRAHVQQAIEEHAHAKTPYGPVVQWLPLTIDGVRTSGNTSIHSLCCSTFAQWHPCL